VGLSAASQSKSRGFPLDYCSVLCNDLRLREPVNYIRANWIRPEDLHYYEKLGYETFKIVERNTPTQILLERVKAYSERRYDGNLLDLVQNYAYPKEKMGAVGQDAYSWKRMLKYFIKPRQINLLRFRKLIDFGHAASMLYPREGANPVMIDNRKLDGFMERFTTKNCQSTDCESCRYSTRLGGRSWGRCTTTCSAISRGAPSGSHTPRPLRRWCGDFSGLPRDRPQQRDRRADEPRPGARRGSRSRLPRLATRGRRCLARRLRRTDVPLADVRGGPPHRRAAYRGQDSR
jgi:hypothetical protein